MSSDAPTDADGTPWPDISYVARSTYRAYVVEYLASHGPSMPSTIADADEQNRGNVSNALSDLRDRGLIELLVDESVRKGRIYGLTDHGREIARELEERGMT